MHIPDHETFGMYARRLDLITPINIAQRALLWSERRAAKGQNTTVMLWHATESMQDLNRWAKTAHGDLRRVAYDLKTDFLHVLYNFGHMESIEPEQQILKCHSCTRGIWERGTDHAERCFRCDGTGVYRRILLWKFTVNIGGERYEFHTPASLVRWDMPEVQEVAEAKLEDLPPYRDRPNARVDLSDMELQEHLVRVAVAIETLMWLERVELNPLGRALRHDCIALANWITRPFYRAYVEWHNRRESRDLPF